MKTRYLLAGISAMAFAATTATAQNTNTITSTGTGNTATCTNNTLGSNGNVCIIEQTGNNDVATVRQPGNNNRAEIRQTASNVRANIEQGNFDPAHGGGNGISENNRALVIQSGGAAGSFTDINQNGDNNIAESRQSAADGDSFIYTYGNNNTVSTVETGAEAVSIVIQRNVNFNAGGSATNNQAQVIIGGPDNYSYVGQEGNGNVADITLNGTGREKPRRATTDGPNGYVQNEPAESVVLQIGETNGATVNQSGNLDVSNIYQGVNFDGQNGQLLLQVSTDNVAQVTQSANNSRSDIYQGGLRQVARVFQQAGSVMGSEVSQRNGSDNETLVFQGPGARLSSDVDQNGGSNYTVTVQNGGVDVNDTVTGRSAGNRSTINQNGMGSTADVSQNVTAAARANFQGIGNVSTVTQNTAVAYLGRNAASPTQQTTTASEGRAAYQEFGSNGNFTGSRGSYASVWQTGQYGISNVVQGDGVDSGRRYDGSDPTRIGGGIARPRAGVFQAGRLNTAGVFQTGDNYASVTQGRQAQTSTPVDVGNVINLVQTDSGDIATGTSTPSTTTTTCDAVGNCTTTTTPGQPIFRRAYNQALLGQFGDNNQMRVTQNARDGYVSTRQQVGSSNLVMDVEQGTGRTNSFAGSNTGSNTPGGLTVAPAITNTAVAGASTSATINTDQGGTNNGMQISQDSSSSFITVTQLGTGSSPVTAANFSTGVTQGEVGGNVIIVAQQGTGNRATATQTATVGRSTNCGASASACPPSGNSAATNTAINGVASPADDFFFQGGGRSAEIDILQGGTNNTATAEQRGLGQYARIEQAGTNNTAGIRQEVGATNATAIIRQSGSGNTYYVVQTAPGQYIAVDQAGTNNSSNNVVIRGASGGGNGFTPASAGF